jgi:hypothetical protein
LNIPKPRAPPARSRARVACLLADSTSGVSSTDSAATAGCLVCSGSFIARGIDCVSIGDSGASIGDWIVSGVALGSAELVDCLLSGECGMPNFTPPSLAIRAAIPERRVLSSFSPVGVDGSSRGIGEGTADVCDMAEGGGLCAACAGTFLR